MGSGYEIAVAGSGIGGLACATLLARDGHRVTLFDRFAAPAPVGSGLLIQPTGLAVLERLGLRDAIEAAGERIVRLSGHAGTQRVLAVEYAALRIPTAWAIGIHRAALFDPLFAAARDAGVRFVASHSVTNVEASAEAIVLEFDGEPASGDFDLLVDATGSRSPLAGGKVRPLDYGALWATVEDRGGAAELGALTQRYRSARQMAGLLPIGTVPGEPTRKVALFWSVRADALEEFRRAGLEAWRDAWAALWPEATDYADQIGDIGAFEFARYHHRTAPRPGTGRLIHIGDSWHSTSPQLGQGANMALLDAWATARALRQEPNVEAAAARARSDRLVHVRLYQAFSLALTPLYQSDLAAAAWLRDFIVAPALRLPLVDRIQARAVAGLIGNPLERLGLD